MTPREIIAEAWAITTREPLIRRWSFISSLLETLLNIKLFGYQAYFAYSYFVSGHQAGLFDDVILLYNHTGATVTTVVVIFFLLLLVVEFFLPHLCLGAVIGLTAKSYNGEKNPEGGLVMGLYNFFPIFAIHEFLFLSSITTLTTAVSLTLRYIDGSVKFGLVAILLIIFCAMNILKFSFSFAEEGVVIQKLGIFQAIARSFKLIVSHLKQVMFLLLLLLVISIRILLNALMVIIIPGIVIGIGFLLTLFLSTTASYILAGIIGVALTVVASYFFAYLHAFKIAVWTITYIELMKKKDLDVIEVGDL